MWGRSGAEWGPTFSFLMPPRRRGAPGGKVYSSAVYLGALLEHTGELFRDSHLFVLSRFV